MVRLQYLTDQQGKARPRAEVRGAYQVLVVDSGDQLRFRDITVLRGDPDRVFVSDGVKPGERVIVSALDTPVEGMRVKALGPRP